MECLGAGAPESHPADSCRLKGNDADDNDKLGTRGACRSCRSQIHSFVLILKVFVSPLSSEQREGNLARCPQLARKQPEREKCKVRIIRAACSTLAGSRWKVRSVLVSNQRVDSPCSFMIGLGVQIITSLPPSFEVPTLCTRSCGPASRGVHDYPMGRMLMRKAGSKVYNFSSASLSNN
jgi:hypothetical protein